MTFEWATFNIEYANPVTAYKGNDLATLNSCSIADFFAGSLDIKPGYLDGLIAFSGVVDTNDSGHTLADYRNVLITGSNLVARTVSTEYTSNPSWKILASSGGLFDSPLFGTKAGAFNTGELAQNVRDLGSARDITKLVYAVCVLASIIDSNYMHSNFDSFVMELRDNLEACNWGIDSIYKCCMLALNKLVGAPIPDTDEDIIDEDIDEDIIDEDTVDEDIIDEDAVDEDIVDEDVIDEDVIDEDAVDEDIVDEDVSEDEEPEAVEEPVPEENINPDLVQSDDKSLPPFFNSLVNDLADRLGKIYKALFLLPINGLLGATSSGKIAFYKKNGSNSLNIFTNNTTERLSDGLFKTFIARPAPIDVTVSARDMAQGKYNYVPSFHIDTISGIHENSAGVTYDYKDHRAFIKKKVTSLALELINDGLINSESAAVKLFSNLSEALLNIVVLTRASVNVPLSGLLVVSIKDKNDEVFKALSTSDFYAKLGISNYTNMAYAQGSEFGTAPVAFKAPNLIGIQLLTSLDSYTSEINFAYKAVNELAQRGQKSDFSAVPFGTNFKSGLPINVNLSQQNVFALSIFAGSGSGKGVLTLATIGTAIATGHPFMYLDSKPDTAVLLWAMAHEYGARCLAVDVNFLKMGSLQYADPNIVPATTKAVFDKYTGANVMQTPLYAYFMEIKKFIEANDPSIRINVSQSNIKSLWVYMLICKYIGLSLLVDRQPENNEPRMLSVLDECNNQSLAYEAAREAINTLCRDIFKALASFKSNKKLDNALKKQAIDYYTSLSDLLRAYDVTPPSYGNYAIKSLDDPKDNGQLTTGIKNYLNQTGRQNGTLMFTVIGQKTAEIHPKFPAVPVIESATSIKLFGNENDKYTHGFTTGIGQFVLQDGTAPKVKIKTYLTFNENDANRAVGYNGKKYFVSGKPFVSDDMANNVPEIWEDKASGVVNPRVGFPGYLSQIAELNGTSVDTIRNVFNLGYDTCANLLAPVLKHGNFASVEDWLYDNNPKFFYPFETLRDACTPGYLDSLSESELSSMEFAPETHDDDGNMATRDFNVYNVSLGDNPVADSKQNSGVYGSATKSQIAKMDRVRIALTKVINFYKNDKNKYRYVDEDDTTGINTAVDAANIAINILNDEIKKCPELENCEQVELIIKYVNLAAEYKRSWEASKFGGVA